MNSHLSVCTHTHTQVDCYYYNLDGTAWGLGSSNEMCIDFLYYYPR